jgi:hypothetical protein
MSETYNGWTNYETWRVHLEMFDGHSPSDHLSRGRGGRSEYIADLSQALCDHALAMIDGQASGLARDYAEAFLEAVNYREIAEALIANQDEKEADEEDEEDELAEA